MSRATGGNPSLLPHFWPYYMLRWVDQLLHQEPHLVTRRTPSGAGFPAGWSVTLLEYDLFHASSLVLDRVTGAEFHVHVAGRGPRRVVVSGDPGNARMVAGLTRAAAGAARAIIERARVWGDRFGAAERLLEAYEPLWRLGDLLAELGMRFNPYETGCVVTLAPRSRLVPPGGDPELRAAYADLYRVVLPFAARGSAPDLEPRVVEQLTQVAARLEAISDRIPVRQTSREARDRFIYEQACAGVPWKVIRSRVLENKH